MGSIDYNQLKKQPWYLDGSRHQAEEILSSEEAGSFIIRPSSQPNCLALSHKVSSGSIGHALIHDTPQGYRLEQTQNAFPSLELLVLSIKKHFTVNDSMSSFGAQQQQPSRLSGSNGAKIQEMSEMFSAHPRESMVAALQLAGGDTEKATELMLSEELFENNRDDEQSSAMSQMVAQAVVELGPKVVELRDAVHAISSFQELKAKVSLGKAVAEIKRALASFPASSKRPKPAELPAGQDGTTQAQLVRFKNTIAVSVWEILRKLDGIGARAKVGKFTEQRLSAVAAALKSVRETLDAATVPMPVPSPNVPRRGPKSDEEFYIDVSEIHKEKEIGKGAYGKVYKGKFRGRVVAIKTIEVKDDKELVLIRREISLLRACDHANIVELIGVSKEGDALLLVTEFVDRGELYKVLLDETINIDWPLRLKIAQDVASGLSHVHSKGLIHRDIKSENLLVNSNWDVKLCDFGFARAVSHGLHRYTICVPEDHEILTNRGYLDLETYKAWSNADAGLLVAGYDVATEQLVFEKPHRLIENPCQAQTLIEFSSAADMTMAWAEGADACAATDAAMSMLVTPQHMMYVQTPRGYEKVAAHKLLQQDAVRQLTGAKRGVANIASVPATLRAALDLTTTAQAERFCEVYGAWLGCGSLQVFDINGARVCGAVRFAAPADQKAWLKRAFRALGVTDVAWMGRTALVRDARWVSVFDLEYGHLYAPNDNDAVVAPTKMRARAMPALDDATLKALTQEPRACAPVSADVGAVTVRRECDATGRRYDLVSSSSGSYLKPEEGRAKWFASWAWSAGAGELDRMLQGLRRAGGKTGSGPFTVATPSMRFRDEAVRVGTLAGYTVSFSREAQWIVTLSRKLTATLTAARGEVRERAYTGRTWCFTMPTGFVWTRRVEKNAAGEVTKGSRGVLTGNCGSMYFNAPELLLGKPYDAKADVFAFGIFLCELITRGAINLVRRKETAFGLDVKSLEQHIPQGCPPLFWKVAFCCCSYAPARRPSMNQIQKMLSKIRQKYPLGGVLPNL